MTPYSLIIRNGRVIDPALGLDGVHTIFVRDGKIAAVTPGSAEGSALVELDATDRLVVPGLIDLHTHCYWGGTTLGVNADKIGPASGVTTWVDTGSAGPGNFAGFFHHVIERSTVRIVPFLNVSHLGVAFADGLFVPVGELFDFRLINYHELLRIGERYGDVIEGIKLRASINASGPNSLDALKIARAAADDLGKRLMVHVGPPPPMIDDVLAYLKAGDILTHCFTPYHGGIVDHHLSLKEGVLRARERGVLFDVGHGSTSFSFEVAEAAMDQGFLPDVISSDIHGRNVANAVRDLPTTLSKFLALGMDLESVLERCTHRAAAAIGRDDLGTLAVGQPADIAVFHLDAGEVSYHDVQGAVRRGNATLRAERTIVAGRIVEPVEDGRDEASAFGPVPRPRTRA